MADLTALRARLRNAPQQTRLFHETLDQREAAHKAFVDPLVYLFWARAPEGGDVLCVLVQFKTVPSREPDHVELDHLYLGTRVYKFNARTNKVALIGLLCSDAFDFTTRVDAHHHNLLLLHLQLNQRPGHVDYAAYRQRLFAIATDSKIEILCLNWATNVLVNGDGRPWNTVAGSAWYLTPNSLAITDDDVDRLHRVGLYYSVVGKRWHGFYLHYGPHALAVRKQRLFADGPQALAQRLPPQIVERRAWNVAANSFGAAAYNLVRWRNLVAQRP